MAPRLPENDINVECVKAWGLQTTLADVTLASSTVGTKTCSRNGRWLIQVHTVFWSKASSCLLIVFFCTELKTQDDTGTGKRVNPAIVMGENYGRGQSLQGADCPPWQEAIVCLSVQHLLAGVHPQHLMVAGGAAWTGSTFQVMLHDRVTPIISQHITMWLQIPLLGRCWTWRHCTLSHAHSSSSTLWLLHSYDTHAFCIYYQNWGDHGEMYEEGHYKPGLQWHMGLFLLVLATNETHVATWEIRRGSSSLDLERKISFWWRAKVVCHSE